MGHKILKGCAFAIISAVIYGSMPLMAKYIYADGVTPFTLVFLRNMFSLLPLGILAYREQKTLKIPLSLLPKITLIALLGCCLTPILLFSSYQFIASGPATVFHFAYPSFVVIGEILFLRKKARLSSLLSILFCTVGICMFYSPEETFNLTGSILSLLSAVTFAAYVVMLPRFDRSRVSGFLFTFYIILMSTVSAFCICVATNSLVFPSTASGWGLCILFSLLVTTCAVVLFQQSAFLIGSEGTSILSTLEPITSVIIGVVIFHEPFGLRLLVGTILVITASVITVFFSLMKKAKNNDASLLFGHTIVKSDYHP